MKKILFAAIVLSIAAFASTSFAQEKAKPLIQQVAHDTAKPGLLVTPTRVVLEGKERSASVSIANNGTKAGVYRLELINKRMTEEGGIEDAPTAQEGDLFATDLLRISPRRVTLEPGQSQSVRILARKPKDLSDGEYRSHLSFIIVPDDAPPASPEPAVSDEDKKDDQLVISLQANFGVTIPVIVRHGKVEATGSMKGLAYHADAGAPSVSFEIDRSGNRSLYGDVEVTYIDAKGTSSIVKSMGGIAIYIPNVKRQFKLPLDVPKGVSIAGGKLKVVYREKEKDGGKVIAEGMLTL